MLGDYFSLDEWRFICLKCVLEKILNTRDSGEGRLLGNVLECIHTTLLLVFLLLQA